MKVKRIVANVEARDISKAKYFYGEVLGLDLLMNLDFITALTVRNTPTSRLER
ncbi:hypothetical protein [Gracilibacillus salinarum]|uniref:hypothetical protein n=1 Tax=Gracilibacillus salinarum TaxID=2932255 RepID=UPI0034E1EA15